jgi:uncharacterized protein YdeI (YjbR/CyaY-like superfamily)
VGTAAYERVHLETREEWRRWLGANHASSPGIWLVSWKKATGKPAVAYEAAVEEALCFGWIDSTVHSLDEERGEQLFTPRRRGSRWSRSNKARVERLLAARMMESAGLAAVHAAKESGAWTALDDAENLVVPADLAEALSRLPGAGKGWDAYPPSVRRGTLGWITEAKRPETRARRIAETASAAASGRRPGPWANV